MIEIYTDGACSGNPGPSGIGVVIITDNKYDEFGRYIGNATNNIAEVTAIKIALENIRERNIDIIIHSDSMYAINVLTGKWRVNSNKELIFETRKLISEFMSIKFKHVRGHSGNKHNERADRLAVAAINRRK